MRTIERGRTPQERRRLREASDRRCRQSLIRLVCVTSMLRTAVTRVIPLAGSAGWWVVPLCSIPGLALYLSFALILRATGTQTIPSCAEKLIGRTGQVFAIGLAAFLLLTEALVCAGMLTRIFTEGFGVEGTRLSITVIAMAPMLVCLDEAGLSRAVCLLQGLMVVTLALAALNWLEAGRGRGFFPLLGDESASVSASFRIGFSLAWPLCLLLYADPIESAERLRWKEAVTPLLICLGIIALFVQAVPNDLLRARSTVVSALLTMTAYLHAPVRMAMYILLMTSLFLSVAGTVTMASSHFACCCRKPWPRLACFLTAAVFIVQLSDAGVLTDSFARVLSMRLWPLTLFAAVLLAAASVRILRGKGDI